MRRAVTVLALTAACLFAPAIANAHPLGNFTINRYAGIRVLPDRVDVHYVVDMAEIPTFQERAAVRKDGIGAYAASTCERIAGDLTFTVDGRATALRSIGASASFPAGAAGLATTRLVCELSGEIAGSRASHAIDFRDHAYAGRLGWREITAVGDRATLSGSTVPTRSVSAELTRYPTDLLSSPLDVREASFRVTPGGTAARPQSGGVVGSLLPRGVDQATQAFQSFLARRSLTLPVSAVALALAIVLGALHALAPGHGKTVMAAYLVGQRGTVRQGILMGLTVTATHTAGVLALGLLVTVSTTVAPERLYPVFGVASGLMLAAIGASLLRRALHARRAHDHDHMHGEALGIRRLLALGFAGGLVPSPSAVVVLLGAMAIGRVLLGVALVFAYGLGMAATLSGAGLLLARFRRLAEARANMRRTRPHLALLVRALPILTASVITIVGVGLAARGALAI